MSDQNTQPNQKPAAATSQPRFARLKWLTDYLARPLLLLAAGVGVLACVGVAQRIGWIQAGVTESVATGAADPSVEYICPMMCVPPMTEPGRCPVCAMELVPSNVGEKSDGRSIVIDPASRRIANITTVSTRSIALSRTIRAIGKLQYDEGSLKTIAAYTAGRFEKLYVDYTGAVVNKGDVVASFYSRELFSAQVEFLTARRSAGESGRTLPAVAKANARLRTNARQRLIELGMQEEQVQQLEQTGKANSRFDVTAPMSGTVIERMISEGDYVKEGQSILKLADLSTVWLMLELFPEDAAAVRYGQHVEASVESLPGQVLRGRVAFVDPEVSERSRTVSVRVVVPNEGGDLRIGEFASATIDVPVRAEGGVRQAIYDPELNNKWISPRHPHVTSDKPGKCRVCGVQLVHASKFGFTDSPEAQSEALVVPRDAVLMAAEHSVVYVETEPGRFEIRRVETGVNTGDDIVIVKGLAAGEFVATRGNFLLDSQMQLAGNPSLIDPTRAAPPMRIIPGFSPEMLVEIDKLPADKAEQAKSQAFCPITEARLGSMGLPIEIQVQGKSVFICCEGCRDTFVNEPEKSFKRLSELQAEAAMGTTSEQDVPMPGDIEMDAPPIGDIEIPSDEFDGPPIGEIELVPNDGAAK